MAQITIEENDYLIHQIPRNEDGTSMKVELAETLAIQKGYKETIIQVTEEVRTLEMQEYLSYTQNVPENETIIDRQVPYNAPVTITVRVQSEVPNPVSAYEFGLQAVSDYLGLLVRPLIKKIKIQSVLDAKDAEKDAIVAAFEAQIEDGLSNLEVK